MSVDNSSKIETYSLLNKRNIITSSDVRESYEKKAQQGTEQSAVRVHDIGSEQFAAERTAKNLECTSITPCSDRKITAGSTLSTAYYLSYINGERKYSDDAREVFHSVHDFAQGDLNKVDAYIKATPYMKDGEFQYNVIKRKILSNDARNDIRQLSANSANTTLRDAVTNSVKIIGKEAFATYHERMLLYSHKDLTIKEIFKEKLPLVASAVNNASNKLLSSDDLGTQTVKGVVVGVQVVVLAVKGTRRVSVVVGNMPQRVVDGAKNGIRTIGRTKEVFVETGQQIKISVVKGYRFVRNTIDTIRANGLISKVVLSKVGHHMAKGVVVGTRAVAKSTTHLATKGAVDLLHGKPLKVASGVAVGVGGLLEKSENDYVRGTGTALKVANFTVKTSVATVKTGGFVVKTATKNGIKGVQNSYQTIKFVKEQGVKRALQFAQAKTKAKMLSKVQKGVSSISQLPSKIFAGIKKTVVGAIIPVLCALVAIVIVGGGLSYVATLFSGTFSLLGSIINGVFSVDIVDKDMTSVDDTDSAYVELDVEDFLRNTKSGIPKLREDYITEFTKYLKNKQNDYAIVRLRLSGGTVADVLTVDKDSISKVFYSEQELIELIKPIFQTKILIDYELEPTDRQAKKVLDDIFEEMFPEYPNNFDSITVFSKEHCGQSQTTGEGTAYEGSNLCCVCNNHHNENWTAKDDCPHYTVKYHSSFICDKCDYEECQQKNDFVINDGRGRYKKTLTYKGHLSYYVQRFKDRDEYYITWTYHGNGRTTVGHIHRHKVVVYYNGDDWYDEELADYDEPATQSQMDRCNNKTVCCSGYKVCNGHSVATSTLSFSGLENVMEKEFNEPIKKLKEEIAELSDEDKEKLADKQALLSQLEESRELCYEYINLLMDSYVNVSDFMTARKKDDFIISNDDDIAFVDFVLNEVGIVGGSKYIDHYNNNLSDDQKISDVEWSGCFIVYCKEKYNKNTLVNRYPTARTWQQSDGSYHEKKSVPTEDFLNNLKVGKSVVFLDFSGNGKAQRCGLVIGKTGDSIYLIEGNCSDRVQIIKYNCNDTQIVGYVD